MLGFDAPQLFSLPPGWAKAGNAIANIIAAMTNPTVANNNMRFISTTSLPQGETSQPRRFYNATTVASAGC